MSEEKVSEIVGLYLDPPDLAVALCVGEKSRIQALDRTQPGLPLKKGRAATMPHDYTCHGSAPLTSCAASRWRRPLLPQPRLPPEDPPLALAAATRR